MLLMQLWIKNITRNVVLPIFVIYAVSPIYLSGDLGQSCGAGLQPAEQKISLGVFWVSFLVDKMIQDDDDANPGPGEVAQALQKDQDDDIVLIKKKRMVLRQSYKPYPVFQIVSAETDKDENTSFFPSGYDVPRDLIHNQADGYHSLSTGLSPPSFLS